MTENRPGAPAPGVNTPPQERSTAGRSSEAGEEQGRSEEHFNIDWDARLKDAVAKTLQEKERRKAERQELALRRMHGLAARHKAKLDRIAKEQQS
jgi:hypothetical protein